MNQQKGFLSKATSLLEKEQTVFLLIHQNTGFVNVNIHYTRNTGIWIKQNKEMGNM